MREVDKPWQNVEIISEGKNGKN